jgi:hypothetical protein
MASPEQIKGRKGMKPIDFRSLPVGARLKYLPFTGVSEVIERRADGLLMITLGDHSHQSFDKFEWLEEYHKTSGVEIIFNHQPESHE